MTFTPVQDISTVANIVTLVRRLTASSGESALSTQNIYNGINVFMNQDFPYAIKMDQMRAVYTFFTEPYRDRYPVDINFWQGFRDPMYCDGIQGLFYKSRDQFYNLWPRFPTRFTPINGDGIKTQFDFTIPAPFLTREVVLGGVDISGNPISVNDDGYGNLQLEVPNPQTSDPVQFNPPVSNAAKPGMFNRNRGNPGLINVNTQTINTNTSIPYPGGIGTVNYQTGVFSINFPVAPASGTQVTLRVSQYQPGRPYTLLFWNNELHVRPIPKLTHKIEIEAYQTPVQFLSTTNNPIVNQWWQYIGYGVAIEILRQRQDVDGVANLLEGFARQESLVLERQGVEEINTRNVTIFSATINGNNNWGNNWQGFY